MSELGIIGQKYENRKNRKRGTLISTDNKYKTMTFGADDGTTFNLSYATFKSLWRKCNDEVIETADVPVAVEVPSEDTTAVVIESENTEDTNVKKERQHIGIQFYSSVKPIIEEFVKSLPDCCELKLLPNKKGFAIKVGPARVFELYCKNQILSLDLYMKKEFYESVDWNEAIGIRPVDVNYKETFNLNTFFTVHRNCLDMVLDSVKVTLNALCEDYKEHLKNLEKIKELKSEKEKLAEEN